MIWQNIKNALISLKSAKLRSVLTMLGVIIGVFAVMVMIGIGDGVKKEVGGQIASLGSNVLTIVSGQISPQTTTARDGQQQRGGGIGFGNTFGSTTLTEKDVQTTKDIDNVVKTASFGLVSSQIGYNGLTSNTAFIISTEPNYFSIRELKLSDGQFFTEDDNINQNYVAVIGEITRQNLFGDQSAIGKEITIRNQKFKIIGILKRTESGFSFGANSDDVVFIPFDSATRLTGVSQVFRILVKVNSTQNVGSTKAQLVEKLKQNHGGSEDFSVLTQDELLNTFNSIFDILSAFVIAIAAISLIVGGIGIMNIMLVTVSERTREIGIRKAMGATFGNIMGQFLTEAIVISLLGGMFGLFLAYVAGQAIERFADITPVFSFKTLILSIGMSLLIGIVFGTAPAIKAARKRPIQALKAL